MVSEEPLEGRLFHDQKPKKGNEIPDTQNMVGEKGATKLLHLSRKHAFGKETTAFRC